MSSDNDKIYRFPGVRPFEDTEIDRRLFFGRQEETVLLLNRIRNYPLVVLFGKSGHGKTSLLNAGLSKALKDEGCFPFSMRLSVPKKAPLDYFFKEIREKAKKAGLEPETGEEDSLWQFFKTSAFWWPGPESTLVKPVVILDQFEEFFTRNDEEARKNFTRNLADLVGNRVPDALRRSFPEGEPFPYSDRPPNVKILISIREDCLGFLEEMTEYIPHILHHRFRLNPLKRCLAETAIQKPAGLEDPALITRPFGFSPPAAKAMLDFLCVQREKDRYKQTDVVEPFQLQLLCRDVEENVLRRQSAGEGDILVNVGDLGGKEGMKKSLRRFYLDVLDSLDSPKTKKNVRKLCETGLISGSGLRLSLEEGQIIETFKVSGDTLKRLIQSRLLRAEPRVGSVYYELSHDSLVEPIKDTEFVEPTGLKLVYFFAKSLLMWAGVLFLTVLIINSLNPLDEGNAVNRIHKEAKAMLQLSDLDGALNKYRVILELDTFNINAYLGIGRIYRKLEFHDKAENTYKTALDWGIKSAAIYCGLAELQFDLRNIPEALANYREALRIDPNFSDAYEGMGDIYEYRNDYQRAVDAYRKALLFSRNNPGIYAKLARAHIRNGEPGKAAAQFRTAIKKNPYDPYLYQNLGDALLSSGDLKEAAQAFRQAVAINPNLLDAVIGLAKVYRHMNLFDEAVKAAVKAQQIDPGGEFPLLLLAESLLDANRYAETESLVTGSLNKENLSIRCRLSMRIILIASHLFRQNKTPAGLLVKDFIRLYKQNRHLLQDIPEYNYSDLKEIIKKHEKTPHVHSRLLLQLLALMEAPEGERRQLLTILEEVSAIL